MTTTRKFNRYSVTHNAKGRVNLKTCQYESMYEIRRNGRIINRWETREGAENQCRLFRLFEKQVAQGL